MTTKAYFPCKVVGRSYRWMVLVILLLVLWLGRLLLLTNEVDGQRHAFVYILDHRSLIRKYEEDSYFFWLNDVSAFSNNTLLEVIGIMDTTSANDFLVKKELVIQEINAVERNQFSIVHTKAVMFAYFREWQLGLRELMMNYLTRIISSFHADFFTSMLLGVTENQSNRELKDLLRRTGISHVLVVSGFHFNLMYDFLERAIRSLSGVIKWLFSLFFGTNSKLLLCFGSFSPKKSKLLLILPKILKIVIILFVLLWYSLLVGISPSLLRAYLTVVFRLLDRNFLHIGLSSVFVLILVGLITLFISPFYLTNLSWQLSMLMTFGVITGSAFCTKMFKQKPKIVSSVFNAFFMLLFSVPFLWFWFDEVYPVSFLANLFLVPLTPSLIMLTLGNIMVNLCLSVESVIMLVFVRPLQYLFNLIIKTYFDLIGFLAELNWLFVRPQNRLFILFVICWLAIFSWLFLWTFFLKKNKHQVKKTL